MGKKLKTNLLRQADSLRDDKKPVLRKGKKSIPWDEDAEILRRLESVSLMLLQGARLWQIAEALQVSIPTAARDKERVKELWAREGQDEVIENRNRSIAQIRYVQMKAWEQYLSNKDAQLLRLVKDCEKDIAALQGTEKPIKSEIKIDANERPYEHLTDQELAALISSEKPKRTAKPDSG